MTNLESKVTGMEADMIGIKGEIREIKSFAQANFDQLGALTEFRTEMKQFRSETNERLGRIEETLDRQEKLIDRLAVRSIEHEADIIALRRAK